MNGQMTRNERALHGLIVGGAYLVYCAAVIYGDLMFLQVVSTMFSHDPVLYALAFGGAMMTAASAMLLPLAKIRWLMPGGQMMAGWVFWLVEITLLAANAALAYSIANDTGGTLINVWRPFAPATPMVAVLGWGLLFMLDPRNKMRHAQFEGFADQVDQYAKVMKEVTESSDVREITRSRALWWARVMADETIPKMLGIPDDVIRAHAADLTAPQAEPPALPEPGHPTPDMGQTPHAPEPGNGATLWGRLTALVPGNGHTAPGEGLSDPPPSAPPKA